MDVRSPRHIGMKRKIRNPMYLLPRLIESSRTFKRIRFHSAKQLLQNK